MRYRFVRERAFVNVYHGRTEIAYGLVHSNTKIVLNYTLQEWFPTSVTYVINDASDTELRKYLRLVLSKVLF